MEAPEEAAEPSEPVVEELAEEDEPVIEEAVPEPEPEPLAEPEPEPEAAPEPEPEPEFAVEEPVPAAAGQSVTLKCIADTHVATHSQEVTNARGGSSHVKIKHREDFPLLKFDTSPIPPNATVKEACLMVHLTDPDPQFFLNHVSASTVPTDWVEGDQTTSG